MSDYELSPYSTSSLPAPHTGLERLGGVISHGSMLLAMPLIWPIAVLLIFPFIGGSSRYVRDASLQALLFQLFATVVSGGLLTLAGMFFAAPTLTAWIPLLNLILSPLIAVLSWPVAAALGVAGLGVLVWAWVIELIATWKAFNGEGYRMPVVGGFFRS